MCASLSVKIDGLALDNDLIRYSGKGGGGKVSRPHNLANELIWHVVAPSKSLADEDEDEGKDEDEAAEERGGGERRRRG